MLAIVLYTLVYRLEARGTDRFPREGPVVLCSNHRTLQDPIVLGVRLPRQVHYMAKEELFRIPLFAPLIRALGAFPVKRGGVSKEAVKTAIRLLQEGKVLGIFPEGRRNQTIGVGKRGAVMMALRANARVVPVAIVGSYRPFAKIVVVYGAPIEPEQLRAAGADEPSDAATELIMSRIREMARTGQPSA
jgi:1-acyl-sn-glycerol-3-phosphate acyltransferase